MKRSILLLLVLSLALAGCAKKQAPATPEQSGSASGAPMATPDGAPPSAQDMGAMGQGTPPGMPEAHPPMTGGEVVAPSKEGITSSSAAGVRWSVPSGWNIEPERTMRVATYSVPLAAGDQGPAECAVFFFGPGQGGTADANIDRWIGQFAPGAKSAKSSSTVSGMPLSRVQVDGTYLAPAGPMMQASAEQAGYRLLGAIVAAPEGNVFFKFTGPKKTVEAATGAFDGMVKSIQK